MSVSPDNATVSVQADKKRCMPKCTRFGVIKSTVECVVLLTLTGLVISNTILIHGNDGAEKISSLDEQFAELRTEYEMLVSEMNDFKQKLGRVSQDYTDYKIATDQSFASVQNSFEAVDNEILDIEFTINQTQLDFENQRDFTTRELELVKIELNTVLFNSTCDEIWAYGVRQSGYYMIQPSLDVVPFEVYCEFTTIGATTVLFYTQTQANWTSTPNADDGCEDRGCFIDEITYNATKYQIEALLYLSVGCEQEIKHVCSTNPLTNYAFWNDRHGREIAYWNGDNDVNATGCACFEDNSCEKQQDFDADRECNCDDNRAGLIDYGVLTSKSQLPVMQLNYGGSSLPFSYINYELG